MSRAFRLGIFIVATLSILAAGILIIGGKQFLFHRTYQLKAEFQNVGGLSDGADVQVGGIRVGTVKYISLPTESNGKLTVVMTLSDSTKGMLHRDSVATIKTEGLVGDKFVEISFGSGAAPPIGNGDTIKGQTPVDVEAAALSATDQAKAAAGAFEDDADALKHNFLLRGYFENRGYENASDLKQNLLSQLPSQHSTKEFVFDAKELFEKSNSAKLKNEKKLKEAGQFLEHDKFKLAVVADSDEFGITSTDRTLTEARANVVRNYLVQNFKIDDTRLKIVGLGKSSKLGDSSKVAILVYD